MSITEYSSVQRPRLFGAMYTNPATGTKSLPHAEGESFENILVQQSPPVKPEEVPGIYVELPGQPDENGRLDYTDPNVRRQMSSLGFPDWVGNVVWGGHNSMATHNVRDEFATIVFDYYKDVKEEFGCDDKSYLPYYSDLPEYDKEIATQMKAAFYEKVKNDPRAETLAGELGLLWPPERNTFETSTGIDRLG